MYVKYFFSFEIWNHMCHSVKVLFCSLLNIYISKYMWITICILQMCIIILGLQEINWPVETSFERHRKLHFQHLMSDYKIAFYFFWHLFEGYCSRFTSRISFFFCVSCFVLEWEIKYFTHQVFDLGNNTMGVFPDCIWDGHVLFSGAFLVKCLFYL